MSSGEHKPHRVSSGKVASSLQANLEGSSKDGLLHSAEGMPSMLSTNSSDDMFNEVLGSDELLADAPIPAALVITIAVAVLIVCSVLRTLLSLFRYPYWYAGKGRENLRLESKSWSESVVNWFLLDWATIFLIQFASAAKTGRKMKIEDIGPVGCEEDESKNNVVRLEKIWNEDLQSRGSGRCNMFWVIVKFVGKGRFSGMLVVYMIQHMLGFMAPTVSMQYTCTHMVAVSEAYVRNPSAQIIYTQAVPVMIFMLLFIGVPIASAACRSGGFMLGFRMNVKLSSALNALIFKKAQRLPLSQEENDLMLDEERELLDWGKQRDSNRKTAYSVMNLCTQDAGESIQFLFPFMAQIIAKVPVLMALMVYTFVLMGPLVGCYALFVMLVGGMILGPLWGSLKTIQGQINQISGQRMSFLQEQFYNIRLIKSYGWEDAVEKISNEVRSRELRLLRQAYARFMITNVYDEFYPRFLLVSALLMMYWVHGTLQAASVNTVLTCTVALRICILSLFVQLPEFLRMIPCLQRVDKYLKLAECPWPAKGRDDGSAPPHISVVDLPLGPIPNTPDAPRIRIKGSFSWQKWQNPALKDINVELRPGELVAVVGEIGSGKSTLLNCMLAELWPCGDSVLEVPRKVAYASQAPHIIEGTLQENVLFYSDMDRDKYDEALFAACLKPDLNVLPGGDQVPIGSRGIVLSGGQRARVSLARAAYRGDCNFVLIDDPFSAVDYPSGNHIMNHLVKGDVLKGRTVVVCTQPDQDRIHRFDRVLLMSNGQIIADGPPSSVVQDPSYQGLLDKYQKAATCEGGSTDEGFTRQAIEPKDKTAKIDALRDEESEESDLDMGVVATVLSIAGIGCFFGSMLFYALTQVGSFLVDMSLARMTSKLTYDQAMGVPHTNLYPQFGAMTAWWVFAMTCVVVRNMFDMRGSMNLVTTLYRLIMHRLLRAPVDYFFDKTPVGRIMNRLSTDINSMDFFWFYKVVYIFSYGFTFAIPIVFVHFVTPIYFSIFMVPFYYLLYVICRMYWYSAVPCRHLNILARSRVCSVLTDAESGHAVVRGYGEEKVLSQVQMKLQDRMVACYMCGEICKIWLMARMNVAIGLMPAAVTVLGCCYPDMMDIGVVVLAISSCVSMILQAETFMDNFSQLQMYMITCIRANEFLLVPQERAERMPGDERLLAFDVHLQRHSVGTLEARTSPDGNMEIVRTALPQRAMKDSRWSRLCKGTAADLTLAHPQVILKQVPGTQVFAAVKSWLDIDPTHTELAKASDWHRLSAVNYQDGDAKTLAEAFCYSNATELVLGISSTWMSGGAKVVMKDVVAGYADIPANILKGVNLTIEPRWKVGIMGSTGCGKSTMLSCFLRLLEIRKGSIEYDGINIQEIGLTTLRRTIGLVPQEPIMFAGSIRSNLDPFHEYQEATIWQALEKMGLDTWVKNQPGQLFFEVKPEGANLSVGERQMFCITRMVLRHPKLLLLDEATSAIDPANQERVVTMLQENFKDATVIAVAHRLETVLDYDVAVVMQEGVVGECGPVKELLQDPNSTFAKMVAAKKSVHNALAS